LVEKSIVAWGGFIDVAHNSKECRQRDSSNIVR
jgi:hypothetical protein